MHFLTYPATNGDALGGTPAASAARGGQVRKDTWLSAHEAALLGLTHIAERLAAHISEQGAENEKTALLVTEADDEKTDSEEPEGAGGDAGHLGLSTGAHFMAQVAVTRRGVFAHRTAEGGSALVVAASANGLHVQWLEVVAVLPHGRRSAAVGADAGIGSREKALPDRLGDRTTTQKALRVVLGLAVATHQRGCFVAYGSFATADAGDLEQHLSLRFLLGAEALQLAITRLREHDQFLTEPESRFGGCAFQKIADGYLAATADLRDLHLAKTAFLNA
jgi:hypothetical protein